MNRGASNESRIEWRPSKKRFVQASALVNAAVHGHKDIVRQLIKSGADVDSGTGTHVGQFEFALGGAAEAGDFEIVKLLLENKANIGALAKGGAALQRAAYGGHKSIVELLLDHGADINLVDGTLGGAVQGAVLGKHMEIVRLLMEKGADINLHKVESHDWTPVTHCRTPLEAAVTVGHIEMTRYLLMNGANIVDAGEKPLAATAASNGDEAILKMLVNAGADIDLGNDWRGPPLFHAIANQQVGTMKVLLEAGADVKMQRCLKRAYFHEMENGPAITPLSAAVSRGFEDGVRLLLNCQASVHATSEFSSQPQEPPLHTAARNGFASIARLLLESGANVNEQIEGGCESS